MIKRPLPLLLAFFFGGIVTGYAAEIPRWGTLALLAAGFVLSLGLHVARRHSASFCSSAIGFFALGICGLGSILYGDPGPDHIVHWAGKGSVVLDGVVSENPRVSEDRTSLVLEAVRVDCQGTSKNVGGRLLLSVGENTRDFKYGDYVRTAVRLKIPRSFANPGGFDYERHLRLQGIRVRGFVDDPRKIVLIREGQGSPWRQSLERFRTVIRERIRSRAPFPEGTLIQAMTLGEQSEIPREIQDRFNRTGTSHIIAISGFNVGIIALIAFFVIRTLLKTSEYLLLRFNLQKLSALSAFGPVVFYAFVAGLGMSTVRALLMTLALLMTILMGRARDLPNTLALAAFVILAFSPAALFDISFQLSFAAVAAILLLMPGVTERLTAWKNRPGGRAERLLRKLAANLALFFAVSAAATLGTLPFIVYYFNRVSNITLVANLLLVPILGFVVLPLSMLLILLAPVSATLSSALIDITARLTRLCLDLNDWLASLPGSSSILTTPTFPEIGAYFTVLIASALILGLPGRTVAGGSALRTRRRSACALGLAVLFLAGDALWVHLGLQNRDRLSVTFLDVGHASCTLVEFPGGRRMLIDGGGFPNDRFDVGRYVVAPFLWNRRIGKIDTIVATHPHPDHVNGLPYILDNFGVEDVWTSGDEALVDWGVPLTEKMKAKGITPRLVTSKSPPVEYDGVQIRILNPGSRSPSGADLDDREINERSVVLHIRWKDASILLPSDIGAPTESLLVRQRAPLASGVLLAPHHGSAYSASTPFLQAVRPSTIVISTGRPVREEVLERFRQTGAAVYRTDVHGAVRITTDGSRYVVSAFKNP
ncbi:MAG: DNA internalization-related competence protein ComEC/Rec2 [Pseudomonadota bacterium]|nr:DNA internalization-related competence protein ComEC/Rec2 [Pseudomonadota bacterium]